MMKIAHIINKLDIGGAERLLSALLPILNSGNFRVNIIILNDTGKAFCNVFKQRGINVISLTRKESVYSPMHVFRLINVLNNCDLVHVHLFPAQYWVAIASMFCRKRPILVTTEHSTFNTRMGYRFLRPLERYIYKRYERIISISDETQNALKTWLKVDNTAKFQVIQNGIDIDYFRKGSAIPLHKISDRLNSSSKMLIQVARFSEQKDQATSIRALKYLPEEFSLVLVGNGPHYERHVKLASQLGLTSRVIFLGFRENIADLTKSACVSIVSSYWEGFGLTAAEAMAAGVPVVASAVGGLVSVVQDAGLIFPPGDAKKLADMVLLIETDGQLRANIVAAQKIRADTYSIQRMASEHTSLYTSLVKNDGA